MSVVIDVHCHIFNADDVPIKGMLRARNFPDWFARLLDRVLQKMAPSGANFRAISINKNTITDDQIDDLIKEVASEDDEIREQLEGSDIEPSEKVRGATPFGFISWLRTIIKGNSQIANIMMKQFREVDLFIPLIIDMELWLKDKVVVPYNTQIVNIGEVCKRAKGKLHPFVPFDPLRQVLAEKDNDSNNKTPMNLVMDAIENKGYLGVKVYPAMGYLPFDNAKFLPGIVNSDKFDQAFDRLFTYCEDMGVPITTHCSPGGAEAYERSGQWGHPSFWEPVLKKHPKLKIDFAHFGGGKETLKATERSWAWEIAKLMESYPNVYTDLGYYACLCNSEDSRKYTDFFKTIYSKHPVISERMMYGSDWQMICVESGQKQYYTSVSQAVEFMCKAAGASSSAIDDVLGLNAMRFLGLSDGQNRQRILSFYSESTEKPVWLR